MRTKEPTDRSPKFLLPTMEEIARRVGVTRQTVSAVLSGTTTKTRVSEATRKSILEVAAEMKYRPNARARAMARQRTNVIGVYGGDGRLKTAAIGFYASQVDGLQAGCEKHGLDLMIFSSLRGTDDEVAMSVADGRVDGVVWIGRVSQRVLTVISTLGLPAITVAERHSAIPAVTVDDVRGGAAQAEYLWSKGHRNIAYHRHFPDSEPMSVAERRISYERTAHELGMHTSVYYSPTPDWCSTLAPELLHVLKDRDNASRPTAILTWADDAADDLIVDLAAHGLRVPDDVAVMGFDGISRDYPRQWQLTTINAAWPTVAENAVDLLCKVIHGEEIPHETILPVELAVGTTA